MIGGIPLNSELFFGCVSNSELTLQTSIITFGWGHLGKGSRFIGLACLGPRSQPV